MTLGVLPLIMAWTIIGTATTVEALYVARILCGLSFGVCYTVIPMYLGEIASPKIRGSITIMVTLMNKTGVLLGYSIGATVSFRQQAFCSLVPPIAFLLLSPWLVESPYFLLKLGEREKAGKCLRKLRGHNVPAELGEMMSTVQKSIEQPGTFRELFQGSANRQALIILIGLTSIQMLCGSPAAIGYSQTIFKKAGTQYEPGHVSIVFAAVQLMAVFLSASIVDRVGRKPLILTSISGMAVCHFCVGTHFLLIRLAMPTNAYVPVVAIMLFIVCYAIGMASAFYAVLGEIFPTHLRAKAGALYTIISSVCSFLVYKFFQVISDGVGIEISFLGFGFICAMYIPFVLFFVPETKCKSLGEIWMGLDAKRRRVK